MGLEVKGACGLQDGSTLGPAWRMGHERSLLLLTDGMFGAARSETFLFLFISCNAPAFDDDDGTIRFTHGNTVTIERVRVFGINYGSRRLRALGRRSPCGSTRNLKRCGCPSSACEGPAFDRSIEYSASSRSLDSPAHCDLYIIRYGGRLMPRHTGSVDPRLQQNRVPAMPVGS